MQKKPATNQRKPAHLLTRLGSPRKPPVGEEQIFSADEAAATGPTNKHVYLWSPRCRICGFAMRHIAEIPAPAEGPDRARTHLSHRNVLCPNCRNDNLLNSTIQWGIVSQQLPVAQ